MGGAVIIGGHARGYAVAHLVTWTPPTVSGVLVLFLMAGLGLVGFLDDFIKIFKQRSLGPARPAQKLVGQALVGVIFAVLALQFPNEHGRTPGVDARSRSCATPALDLAFAGHRRRA